MAPSLNTFHYFYTVQGKLAQLIGTGLALLAGHYAAPFLPPVLGWENGLLENLQVLVLLWGGCWAYGEARRTAQPPKQAFWWIITPLWFVMALRELSWGACLLMPLYFDPLTGPVFSSSQQLIYKPLVAPLLGLVVASQLIAALRWRLDKLWLVLWRAQAIPLIEIGLFVACLLVASATENQMKMPISASEKGSLQLQEEWAELVAYGLLFIGQTRVMLALRKHSAPPTQG